MTTGPSTAAAPPLPATTVGAPRADTASHQDSRGSTAATPPSAAPAADPPLPDEDAPPLPDEAPPDAHDDGWEPQWDSNASAWYFYNKRTGLSQWENPRVPSATASNPGPHDRFANYRHILFSFLA